MPNAKPPTKIESFTRECTLSDVLMNLDHPIVVLRKSIIEKIFQIETDVSLHESQSNNALETIVEDTADEFTNV